MKIKVNKTSEMKDMHSGRYHFIFWIKAILPASIIAASLNGTWSYIIGYSVIESALGAAIGIAVSFFIIALFSRKVMKRLYNDSR